MLSLLLMLPNNYLKEYRLFKYYLNRFYNKTVMIDAQEHILKCKNFLLPKYLDRI